MDILEWLDSVRRDFVYGWRSLRGAPAVAVAAILSLALGVGANTAIFSVMNAVMFKMLPVRNPDQLEQITWFARIYPEKLVEQGRGSSDETGGQFSADYFSYSTFERLRAPNAAFESVFGYASFYEKANVVVDGRGEVAGGQFVTGDYFGGLGVRPHLGRLIEDRDDREGAEPIAVISHRYWQGRFGGDPSVIGKNIAINRVAVTVVGITPSEFFGVSVGKSPDFSLPIRLQPQITPRWAEPGKSMFLDDRNWWIQLMGRRRLGVTEEQSRAELNSIFQGALPGLAETRREEWPQIRVAAAARGLEDLRARFSRPLLILMAIVGFVLLIACANVANLLLARSSARRRETAMRYALGAGRSRLIRQMLTESLLLALLGGALGFSLARWAGAVLVAMVPGAGAPVVLPVSQDWRVIGFAVLVSLLTSVFFSVVPALHVSRVDLNSALKDAPGAGGGRQLSGKFLVIGQAALSLVLLLVAGLFLRSLAKLNSVDLGFQSDHVLVFSTDPSLAGYRQKDIGVLLPRLLEEVRALPATRAAALSTHRLIANSSMVIDLEVPGFEPADPNQKLTWVLTVDPQFFPTMGIPLLSGRPLEDRDMEGGPRVAVANETFAKRFFGGRNPVGQTLMIGVREKAPCEIVGLVKDTHYTRVRGTTPPTLYYSYRQHLDYVRRVHFEIRTWGDPLAAFPSVRQAIRTVDPTLPVFEVTTQTAQIDDNLKLDRMFAKLAGSFGAVALVLAMIGLYGVLSYGVSKRIREIGVRVALGAGRSAVLRMILRESLVVLAAGLAIGLGLGLAITRVIGSVLYDLPPYDPVTFIGATLVLLVAGMFAAGLPARRAAKIDPLAALRHD